MGLEFTKEEKKQSALYLALREELGNLREYNEAGELLNPLSDEVLARVLAQRLYKNHGIQ